MNAKTMITARTLVLAAGTLAGAGAPAHGAVLTWSNAAGGSAAVTTNWSPIALPGAGDTLVFNTSATFTVTFGATVTASTSHTYKRGNVTVSLASPHTTSSFVRVGDVSGDAATMSVGSGTLHAGGGISIGNSSGAAGTLTVTNEATFVDTTGGGTDIIVGNAGTGTLNITGGALVRPADDVIIGGAATASGTVTVSGGGALPLPVPSSTLDLPNASQDLIVGQSGDGVLNVLAGAQVTADELFLGLNPGSLGQVTVGGTGLFGFGSAITIATGLHLGNNPGVGQTAGVGSMTINADGVVTVGGTTRIADANGVGSGTLTVNSGGLFTTTSLLYDNPVASVFHNGGEISVDGGTLSPRDGQLIVSGQGSPRLNLRNGATCTLSAGTAPFRALVVGGTSNGSLFVQHAGSTLNVSSGDVIVGDGALSNASLQYSLGATGQFPTGRFFTLGNAGRGLLLLNNNITPTPNRLSCGTVRMGSLFGGDGSAFVAGLSEWHITGSLNIGGTESLGGGLGRVDIGASNNANGLVRVTSGGAGTTSVRVWSSNDSLTIVNGGRLECDGTIQVNGGFTLDGGTVVTSQLNVQPGGTASLAGEVRGVLAPETSSIATLTGDLTITPDHPASAAGVLNSGMIEVGDHALTVNVGPLGQRDINTCHVGAAGRLAAPVSLNVGPGATLSGSGTIDAPITNAGSVVAQSSGLTFTKVLSGIGNGISGSQITFGPGGGFTGSGVFSNLPIIGLAGSTITATGDLTMGHPAIPSGFNSALGRIVVAGAFDVTLQDSSNAVAGDIVFPTGLGVAPSVVCTSGLAIAGTVTGSGTLAGDSTSPITLSGTISPGSAGQVGQVNLRGDAILNSSARLEFDIFSATASDRIHTVMLSRPNDPPFPPTPLPSDITLGGTLVVRIDPAHTPTNLEAHHLISTGNLLVPPASGRVQGNFSAVDLPPRWRHEIRPPTSLFNSDGLYIIYCAADFNSDGNLDPDDLSDYITCFFTQVSLAGGCPDADFNADGNVDPDDLSDYITAFFTGCG